MVIIMRLIAFFVLTSALTTSLFAQEGLEPATTLRFVNQIQFTGNTLISNEDLLQAIPIKPGDLVNTAKIQRAVDAIQQLYRERGYLAAIDTSNLLTCLEESGTLLFPIIEARIGEVKFEGLTKTPDWVLIRLLDLQPGQIYSVTSLQRDAEELRFLGLFESIDTSIQPMEQLGLVAITWHVVERKKLGYVSLSGGYGPRGGLAVTGTLTKANMRHRAEKLQIVGGINSVDVRPSGELIYYMPWIAPKTSLNSNIFSIIRYHFSTDLVPSADVGRYFERRTGARFVANKELNTTQHFLLGTRYENVAVEGLPIQDFTTSITSPNGQIFGVSGELVTDRRNSIIYPTRGYLWDAFVEPAVVWPKHEGTNFITRGTIEGRKIFPLQSQPSAPTLPTAPFRHQPRVVAVRAIAGTSVGRLPFFEQYFVGGQGSLRGYRDDRFWGPNMFLGTVEFRQPITGNFAGIAFVDVGDAWGSIYQFEPGTPTNFTQHDNFSPRVGYGVGLRYVGSLGAIGLDLAWGEGFRPDVFFGTAF
jgi:outer membrane protein insertion porin family